MLASALVAPPARPLASPVTRPNPIGLSLCKLQGVEGNELTLSGVDLIDGTPILDIKPYIPCYDAPAGAQGGGEAVRCPAWSLPQSLPSIQVSLTPAAAADLQGFRSSGHRPRLATSWDEAMEVRIAPPCLA